MKISGFTFSRNGQKLYYPVKESILSILDLVDEFVVVLGDGDPDDRTEEEIRSIKSDKIKIINTVWDLEKYPDGMEYAHQTDIAKQACTGDWLFYLQGDEALHERYLPVVKAACKKHLHDARVEGFLFGYKHFWGDYNHYHKSRVWYPCEIRMIRNDPEIHSWRDAQAFRRIPEFDGLNYRRKENTFKLKVVEIEAEIYHYGWVRPPAYMLEKRKSFSIHHRGESALEEYREIQTFDYGPLGRLARFKETHPQVMKEKISQFHWGNQLNYTKKYRKGQKRFKHDRWKYRLLTALEQALFGRKFFGSKNHIKVGQGWSSRR